MIKELTMLWTEYKTTERYTEVVQGSKLASAGMGFLASETDLFADFMDWLIEKQGTSNG